MKRFSLYFYLFSLVILGCATQNGLISQNQNQTYQTALLCPYEQAVRGPASGEMCADVLAQPSSVVQKDTAYAKHLDNEPEAAIYSGVDARNRREKDPVRISDQIKRFRDRFLSYFKNITFREPLTRSFESSLRMQSKLAKDAIKKNENYDQYDLVIVGSGVHGIIALNEALAKNPNLKVLVIDEGDTAGATFRYGKEAFNINSSNRASGINSRPLPGQGNINELPGLPFQLSELSNVKYPTANDLGSSLVAGLYAAVREYPNVNVVFNSKAHEFLPESRSGDFKEALRVRLDGTTDVQIDAQKVVIATGLGESKVPKFVKETLLRKPELTTSTEPGKLPKVINFEDLIREIGSSNHPLEYFRNKNIGIAGTGDSANVLIEFMLGLASKEAYGLDTAQDGRPRKISWIGQDKGTCNTFIATIRSRYQAISTGYRSSAPGLKGILDPVSPNLVNVEELPDGKLKAITNGQTTADGSRELDVLILTTGFEQNARALFENIFDVSRFQSDKEFFDSKFVRNVESETTTSPQATNVARKVSGREIYFVGTGAGKLPQDSELVGIVQNSVSIFNNAPRTVAATALIVDDLTPKAKPTRLNVRKVASSMTKPIEITGIQETRIMGGVQNTPFLRSTFNEALSYLQASGKGKLGFSISLKENGNLLIQSTGNLDITPVVNLLAESREFFSLAKVVLTASPERSLELSANSGNGRFDMGGTQFNFGLPMDPTEKPTVLANAKMKLRGIDAVANSKKENAQNDKRDGAEERGNQIDEVRPGNNEFSSNLYSGPSNLVEIGERDSSENVRFTGQPARILSNPVSETFFFGVISKLTDSNIIKPSLTSIRVSVSNQRVRGLSYQQIKDWIEGLNHLSADPRNKGYLEKFVVGYQVGQKFDIPSLFELGTLPRKGIDVGLEYSGTDIADSTNRDINLQQPSAAGDDGYQIATITGATPVSFTSSRAQKNLVVGNAGFRLKVLDAVESGEVQGNDVVARSQELGILGKTFDLTSGKSFTYGNGSFFLKENAVIGRSPVTEAFFENVVERYQQIYPGVDVGNLSIGGRSKNSIKPVNRLSYRDVKAWLDVLNSLSNDPRNEAFLSQFIENYKTGNIYDLPAFPELLALESDGVVSFRGNAGEFTGSPGSEANLFPSGVYDNSIRSVTDSSEKATAVFFTASTPGNLGRSAIFQRITIPEGTFRLRLRSRRP